MQVGQDARRWSSTDEQPLKARPDKIPTLKPAFRDGGTVTAANSSSISDGAAALVLMRRSEAEKRGCGAAGAHRRPCDPRGRAEGLPDRADRRDAEAVRQDRLERATVDLFEINEAFAVVAMAAMRDLALPHDKVNVNGGACALGHPIGASGARILVTLLGALQARGLKRGVASLCIGGGEATAMAIEAV